MKKIHKILIVDDNPADVELMTEALNECSTEVSIQVARNAVESFDILKKIVRSETEQRPAVIILDLNMPIFNGEIVLEYIKEEPRLQDLPVVIWTSSTFTSDPEKYRNLGANEYLVKPLLFSDYRTAIAGIRRRYIG